jgi:hypothetical protein
MSGCEIPESRKIPLVDSHYRGSTNSLRGSVRDLRIENDQLVGRAQYSETADESFKKVKEGHLDKFSVGYRVLESVWVEAGTTATVNGRQFTGPVKVVTRWQPKELSEVVIPADEAASVRAAAEHNHAQEAPMPNKEKENKDGQEQRSASTQATAPATATAAPGENLEEIRANAAKAGGDAELSRVNEIMAIGERAGMSLEDIREACRNNTTVNDFGRMVIEKAFPDTDGPGHRADVVTDERDKVRAAAIDSLAMRGGLDVAAPAAGAVDMMGYSLRELARELLGRAGQRATGNILDIVGRALTSSDLPVILGTVANLSLMEGWESEPDTYSVWTGDGSVSDFKLNTMARLGGFSDLEKVNERGEYTHGQLAEESATYKVDTYGKILALTRQMIINDDLDALTTVPREMGEAARRLEADLVYALLLSTKNLPDGKALFHASRGNLLDAAGITVESIDKAKQAMRKIKDIDGSKRLNIVPGFIITPTDLELSAAQILASAVVGTQAAPNLVNPLRGTMTVVSDTRLDDVPAWYTAAPKGKTIKRYYLNGVKLPRMEQKAGWTVDGVELKISHDVGVALTSWRGLNKTPKA